jgi:hypothetical protein
VSLLDASPCGTPLQEWRAELLGAMQRVKRMRQLTVDALAAKGTPGDWSHITRQIGMFSYTGACVRARGLGWHATWPRGRVAST